jgi:hypothetical protein
MRTLLLRFQQLRNGLPSLNVAVLALNMIHAKDVQKVQQHQKPLKKCSIWYWMTGGQTCVKLLRLNYRHFKRTCRIYFAWRIGYEKALRRMGAALAHSRSKTHSHENLWSVLTKIKLILCIDLLLRMRLGFNITHQNPNSSQNSDRSRSSSAKEKVVCSNSVPSTNPFLHPETNSRQASLWIECFSFL